jgi:hypothetical protein
MAQHAQKSVPVSVYPRVAIGQQANVWLVKASVVPVNRVKVMYYCKCTISYKSNIL